MRTQRIKQQDWSKPFKMVFSKHQFQDMQTSDDTIINTSHIKQKQPHNHNNTVHKKQQIITPQISTIKRVTDIKPFAKLQPNYVRLQAHLNLPRLNDYQLSQIDHVFISTHKDKYKMNNKIVLTNEFLKNVIIALQKKQGKDMLIQRNKSNLMNYLEKEYKQLAKISNYQGFTDLVYNYWRNRREEVKFPLFRPLWRPNQDEYNHLLAFKFRQKQKRTLRRSNRTSQQDMLQQLANQLSIALKIAQRVELRQKMKQRQVQIQLHLFHNQLKGIFPPVDFLTQSNSLITLQCRNKDKQRIKRANLQVQKLRKQRQIKNQQYKQPQPTIFDQKQSVVNFLATVVAEAEACGLGYDKIFHYKSQKEQINLNVQGNLPVLVSNLSNGGIKEAMMDVQQIQQQQQVQVEEQCLNMSLKRAGDYIMRYFQLQQQQQSSQQQSYPSYPSTHPESSPYPLKNISLSSSFKRQLQNISLLQDEFDFKKKKVCLYYFGNDDEGEYQNLRKNIAMSFKKFQMQKEMQ